MEKDRRTGFTLDDVKGAKRFETPVRDKDNAAPRVPPPSMARTPHPRLAPPGSVGIRPSLYPVMDRAPPQLPQAKIELGQQDVAKRSFKPLVQKSPDKGRTPER
jgi:hypothetical protein